MQTSFMLPSNGKATPQSVERKRRMAQTLMEQGMQTSPIASPWQGFARIAQALSGGLASRQADPCDAENGQPWRTSERTSDRYSQEDDGTWQRERCVR